MIALSSELLLMADALLGRLLIHSSWHLLRGLAALAPTRSVWYNLIGGRMLVTVIGSASIRACTTVAARDLLTEEGASSGPVAEHLRTGGDRIF